MLNDIRLHLDSDECSQSQSERELAHHINILKANNIEAFEQYVPSIAALLPKLPFERLSVFVDKDKAINFVDFQSGVTLYGIDVDASIKTQADAWAYNSALLDISHVASAPKMSKNCHRVFDFSARQTYARQLQTQCQSIPIDTLVILGIGKGQHISHLLNEELSSDSLNTKSVKHLVIYEPDWEVFRCSLSVYNWATLLADAQRSGLQIFFRIGTDLSALFDEITELSQHLAAKRLLFYKHINLPIFMQIIERLQGGSWSSSITQISDAVINHQYHHLHIFSALNAHEYEIASASNTRFTNNMRLFAEYFPDVHDSFKTYQPQAWQTIYNSDADLTNLVNMQHGNFYACCSAIKEAQALAQHYINYPNLDGLVFGYAGDKLRHYLHNTFIRKADMLLRESQESQGELPYDVKVLMVFGLGDAYMFNRLYELHDIQNLIICEPNPDLFYASLHAIDWQPIFDKVNQGEYKLYINIGEASSLLFKDLMAQFLIIGPHLLNETFIMQAYHNPMLHQVLGEVRQQLQVIFAMGENFDHVAYGIAHTIKAIQDKVPALRYEPAQYLHQVHKQTPIFLVGNGPSLDHSIDIIKENREHVIVVSCGTALQALYKNNIVPDFHGEVEQNRANFDWASRINDREYLKKITLISVNGIHPDTCRLYKNVLIAFKSGESSTHSVLAMLKPNSYHCIDHAYPTVTNMAMSFFLTMGFEQLYLIGVDLGFADQSKHHSSASGYYENGKQIYDYQRSHQANLRVKGNRQEWVFTKTEFNISRMIIEQLLHESQRVNGSTVECFNLSDGVYIEGTLPLLPESVLVVASEEQKQQSLHALNSCFMTLTSDVKDMLNKAYQKVLLDEQFASLVRISEADLTEKQDVEILINQLSDLLRESKRVGKSLFFYYFFNTVNYFNAALSKASLTFDTCHALYTCKRLQKNWQVLLSDAKTMLNNQFDLVDTANAFGDKRETFLLEKCPSVRFFCTHKMVSQAASLHLKSSVDTGLIVESCLQKLNQLLPDLLKQLKTKAYDKAAHFPIVISLDSYCDIAPYIPLLNNICANAKCKLPIGLLFHDYALLTEVMKKFELANSNISRCVCFLYCSPYVKTQSSEKVQQGLQDVFNIDELCHFVQARGQDLQRYSLIVAKPRFCEQGVQNVNLYNQKSQVNEADESLSTSSLQLVPYFAHAPTVDSVDNDTYKDSSNDNKMTKAKQKSIDEPSHQLINSDYDSLSVAIINQEIIQHLPIAKANQGYMFKHYYAYPRRESTSMNPGAQQPLYIVDGLENRGYLMNRLPFDFELMGSWQSADIWVEKS